MFNDMINILEKYKYEYITKNFKSDIKNIISQVFSNLNEYDINILTQCTSYMVEDISIRYNINNNKQWTQNNARDLLSLCLTLLPFMNDSYYSKISSLKELLYRYDTKTIPSHILDETLKNGIKKNFPYSNFSLGLLNHDRDTDKLLDLYMESTHLIYHMIENNFISMLETIKITTGKLYVNWLNTIPLVDYNDTMFYKKSKKEIDNIIENPSKDNIINRIDTNRGLWLGDYYNVLTNGYYYSIKKIKWVIFCTKIKSEYFYSIQYLNKIFDINKMFYNYDYDSMIEIDRNEFSKMLKLFTNNIKNRKSTYKDFDYEIDLIKNLLIFMVNNYTDKNLLNDIKYNDAYTPFKMELYSSKEDLEQDEESIKIRSDNNYIDMDMLENALTVMDPKLLWNYIKETLVSLQSTVYGFYLIKDNMINMDLFNFPSGENKGVINLKNIYNIAKILCHDSNFNPLSTNFKGLDKNMTVNFFRQYSDNRVRWLNIPNNIKIQEGKDYNDTKYNDIINQIKKGWYDIRIQLIWDYLSYNGLLTDFRINISENKTKKDIIIELKEYFNMNPLIFNENYFMTNMKYNDLIIYNKNELNNKISYKDQLIQNLTHYTFYANDWISQLNFFNHYINHNIIYVTGSTGTGKSTQFPKLTLYALKMYDYKMNGKVVCTQPRIEPTQSNATRIAEEMGLNILNKMKEDEKTELYYLQYKHHKGKHTKELCSHLTLRMVTDGTLLEELVSNPLLKKKFPKVITKTSKKDLYSYSTENTYDIVIVDEAHEHNANMDLILTLMRQTCLYNNSIRMVIVSATMEDDEPIYRYYYKLINDMILYPIKQPTIHPILNTEYLIQSIYLDRRMNISVPRQSTQYKVIEIYDEMIEKKFTSDMKKNNMIATMECYKVVNEICMKNLTGDILLFSVGKMEIIESVNYLNNILPSNTVALPYYSEMAEEYRELISNIHIKVGSIRNKRSNIGEKWGTTYIVSNDVSEGTYTRAVIIATNVAEASITISSLKFVVDTGFAKVSRYNEITDTSEINIEMISESSRIQRKGRVGRVGEGTAYFIYGKDKRLNVPPKYNITTTDFHSNFLKLSSENKDDEYLLWDNVFSPYLPIQFNHNIGNMNNLIRNPIYKNLNNIALYGVNIIIVTQFLINNNMIPSYYFYPFNEYGITNNKTKCTSDRKILCNDYSLPNYLNRYPDGYNSEQLFDTNGSFYIIHPFEDRIKRNIMGEILTYKNKEVNKNLEDYIYEPMIKNMGSKMLYFNINDSDKINEGKYMKTNYIDRINEVVQIMNTNMDEKQSTILLLGAGYNIMLETIMVLSLLQAISNIMPTVSMLVKLSGKYIEIDKIKNIFGSDSDITSLYYICKKIQDSLPNLELFRMMDIYRKGGSTLDSTMYIKQYNELVLLFRNKEYIKIGAKNKNLFNWLQNNGKLDNNIGFISWLSESGVLENKFIQDIKKNKNEISRICDIYNLNYTIIDIYLYKLIRNMICILGMKKDDTMYKINVFDWVKNITPYFTKNLKSDLVEDKLNICFLYAQPLIAVRKDSNYMTLRDGSEININMLFNQPNTMCNTLGNYLYYYSMSNDKMYIIANINPINLPLYYPLHYNPSKIKIDYVYYSYEMKKIIIKQFHNSEWEKLVEIVKNNYSFTSFPFNNIEFPTIQQYIKTLRIL